MGCGQEPNVAVTEPFLGFLSWWKLVPPARCEASRKERAQGSNEACANAKIADYFAICRGRYVLVLRKIRQ